MCIYIYCTYLCVRILCGQKILKTRGPMCLCHFKPCERCKKWEHGPQNSPKTLPSTSLDQSCSPNILILKQLHSTTLNLTHLPASLSDGWETLCGSLAPHFIGNWIPMDTSSNPPSQDQPRSCCSPAAVAPSRPAPAPASRDWARSKRPSSRRLCRRAPAGGIGDSSCGHWANFWWNLFSEHTKQSGSGCS